MSDVKDANPVLMTPKLARQLRQVPMAFKMAAVAMTNIVEGNILVRLPDGRSLLFQGHKPGKSAVLEIKDFSFIKRVAAQGDIGFAEGLMAGEWETPDLAVLLEVFSSNLDLMPKLLVGGPLWMVINNFRHKFLKKNTKSGSKKNILAHYDLGNNFYSRWLDPSMTYSSAVYEQDGQDLTSAQMNKYRALAEQVDLQPGQHVLEIGCGWGGFAEYAAREYGARVTGVTISEEQYRYATERMAKAGLSERVDIRLMDYRDIEGQYDAVVSIEMFEAVGEEYWPTYFDKVNSVLKPGGKAGLQIITIDDRLFDDYRSRADFIQSYVFPGGMLPSVSRLKSEVARAGLVWQNASAFGLSYADTLATWAKSFLAEWIHIKDMGFDERFKQLWRFYLAYCEAGFRTGRIDVGHFSMVKP
ncbi:tuberculostearic acid methyltransferase UfaA1 [Candidatus Phycosocius bacilliformis]|uniref:Tuberculostearic acid methyltransferase UfaA1 n=1 Tax=Candidatus Phycosocius bacilliformis TaxID=1445552 RepID=A0A2P2E849_9PROT|nr:cyclopropane-fatty-acyl-phospholipid synthase family protein [Candidatus Phycosocius bacilliformis]GBF57242.1 tuberculostearic acid methyltransferase UfaA1 [Candidatus Phycosocius bacilliformis]